MTGGKIWHGVRWDISHPIQPLSRADECSLSLLCSSGWIVWANRLHQRGLPCIAGFYAESNRNGPSPLLIMDARHTNRHRGWCGGGINVIMGHLYMLKYLCTYPQWCKTNYVWIPNNTCERRNWKLEHDWKYILWTLVPNFQFRFFLCRKMQVLAGFLRCMPPTRKFVNNLQKWNIITKMTRDIMTW